MSQPNGLPKQPTAPVVALSVDPSAFNFGPPLLVQKPAVEGIPEGAPVNATNGKQLTPLSVLGNFKGTFKGFGFNTIFRPNSDKTPTKLPKKPSNEPGNNPDNVLELDLTSETQTFGEPLDDVPNRGLAEQADISLRGVPYTQSIIDTTEIVKPPETQPVIHFEPGLWMRVPASTTMPNLTASFSRMASIPHGTTINAQCFQDPVKTTGAPIIPPAHITPTILASNTKFRFLSQDANNDATRRLPQDLSRFIKAGTITQEMLDNPNVLLINANKGKNIIDNTVFTVLTQQPPPNLGGGTGNIGFLIGADAGIKSASVAGRSGNANAVRMQAMYWVSTVRAKIDLKAGQRKGDRVSPARGPLGARDAVPTFILDKDITTAKTIQVDYTQIQYSQNVDLDFNGLRWPHATVATLAPVDIPLPPAV